MKVKMAQILNSIPSLKKLGTLDCLTAKQAYSVGKMLRLLQEHLNDFTKGRDKAMKKYADAENKEALNNELSELLDTEIDIECSVVDLPGDAKGLTPNDFNELSMFITVK